MVAVMSELSEIYGESRPLWELLQVFRKKTCVTAARPGEPKNIAGRVCALEYQMAQFQDIWARVMQPQPQHEKEIYDADIARHQRVISNLESLAKTALADDCAQGLFIGIGFIKSYPPSMAVIHPNEWAFLEVNFKENSATYTHETYEKIRLVRASDLTKEEIRLLINISEEQIAAKAKKIHTPQSNSPQIVQNYHMGDTYHIQQAAAVGPQATANNTMLTQKNSISSIDYEELASQLSKLRSEMRNLSITAEHAESLGAIVAAEKAVRDKNIVTAKNHLKKAGAWALSIAENLGIELVVKVIEMALTE